MAQGHEPDRRLNFEGTQYPVKCIVCGKQFQAKRADASTCSARCRKQLSRDNDSRPILAELRIMAARADRIAQDYHSNATVYAQMLALEAMLHRAVNRFELRQLSLPGEVLEVKN